MPEKTQEQKLEEQRLWLDFGTSLAGLGKDVGQTVLETQAQKNIAALQYGLASDALRARAPVPIAAPSPGLTPAPGVPASKSNGGLPGWAIPVGIGAAALGVLWMMRK